MSVWCNACGQLSHDNEFCDHCNAELANSGHPLPPERCPLTSSGIPLTLEQRQALVFPESSALVKAEGQWWRVHWISESEWKTRAPLLEKRLALSIAALPTGRLIEEGASRWLVLEAVSSTPAPWSTPKLTDPYEELQRLTEYVQSLAHALEALHKQQLVWLRFDPSALEDLGPLDPQAPQGDQSEPRRRRQLRRLRITNLDVELFPFRSMPERVRVHPQYAAPEIVQFRMEDIGPRTDVFHLAMFTYYWLTGLLPDGLPGDGLEHCEYDLPFVRIYAPQLPIGIAPVLRRGLALIPKGRHETPLHFADALAERVESARARQAFTAPLRFETGGVTRTGRAKAESGRVNEDTIFMKDYDQGALVAVADGVSTCDIGSGALASMMAMIVLENAFVDGCTHETFKDMISAVTKTGATGLLEWALARGCRAELEAGKDLMGTTLAAGWLQDHELSVANLGDSRAYIITDKAIEQLTVDGDLASDLFSQGASPQEVRELGAMARALRECVGGCTKTPDGQLCILPDCAHPRVTRWPLLPGDIIVLCSDGLVEEGYFLEPRTVHELVRRHRDLPAGDLALRLVEAADALQRLPTALEPEGFGDNISCVVIKVLAIPSQEGGSAGPGTQLAP